jgi:hypothetical protein
LGKSLRKRLTDTSRCTGDQSNFFHNVILNNITI